MIDQFPKPKDYLCHFGGGSGGGGGISGQIYQPQNQQGIDTSWNNLFNQLQGVESAGTSPGQQAWPNIAGSAYNVLNNPYQGQAMQGAGMASALQQMIAPGQMARAQAIGNYGELAAPYGQAALAQGQNPTYQQAGATGQMLAGGAIQNAANLQGAGMSDLMAGYDPQSSLYNRTQSQVADQINAQLANSGLGGTPYGASVAGNTLSNFNIDWQNQQLQRQLAAGQGAASMFGAQTGQGSAALSDILTPANAAGAAQSQAAQTYGNFGQSLQAGGAAQQALENQVLQATATYGALPYQSYNDIQQANFGALQNEMNLGNQALFGLPEQLMGAGQSYMQLGQSANATAAANNLAQNQQMMQGLSGLGGLVGGLNNWGTSGSGGLLGSLFGGGGFDAAGAMAGGGGSAGFGASDAALMAAGLPFGT